MGIGVSRRSVLKGSVVGTAAVALGAKAGAAPAGSVDIESPLIFHSPEFEPFCDELPSLSTLSGNEITLTAQVGQHAFHRDFPSSPALSYRSGEIGGGYLGPTVEAHSGESIMLTFENDLTGHPLAADMDMTLHGMQADFRANPPTSLHLHGGVTSPESDGHPELLVMPGQAAMHHFSHGQEAAHLWYHDHAMGITRLNVYAGLIGNYLIRDEFDTGELGNPLGLPAEEFEIPLILQEKIFTPTGAQNGRSTILIPEGSWEGGAVGDVGLVNGKVWPELSVARGLYRLRIVNASSASVWNLHFSNMMTFWVIGNDAGMLDAPVAVNAFRCAPGERYDLLVDFTGLSEGSTVELRNDEAPPLPAAVIGEVTMPLFCRFRGDSRRGFTGGVPSQLRGGRRQRDVLAPWEQPTVIRTVTVSQQLELRNPRLR